MTRAVAPFSLLAAALLTSLTSCARSTADLSTVALHAERRAADAEASPGAKPSAGPGARLERLPASADTSSEDASGASHGASGQPSEATHGASGQPSSTGVDRFGGLVAAGDTVFIADDRTILRLGGERTDRVVSLPGDASPDRLPLALAISPGGILHAAAPERGEIVRLDPRTGTTTRVAAGLSRPSSMVVLGDGSAVVVESGGGRLSRVDTAGSISAIATNLSSPLALAVLGGRFLVCEANGGRIVAVRQGSPTVAIASGLAAPVGVATDRAGRLVVAEAGTGTLVRFDGDATRTVLATGLALRRTGGGLLVAAPIAFDAEDRILLMAPGDGSLWRITPP